jgi:shikimate dehydrogenase
VGLSLTMPLKRVALAVADEVAPLAAAVGAANTLVLAPGGGRRAENTDVVGIVAALREAGVERAERAVVLGAGGTAQAALAALGQLGVHAPTVLVRDPARTTELRATADRLGLRPRILAALPQCPDAELAGAEVVISTLPAGAADELTVRSGVVLDVVYAPWPTRFGQTAADRGCRVVSGLEMLLHQAVAQIELMTGRPGPVDAMREALRAAVPVP